MCLLCRNAFLPATEAWDCGLRNGNFRFQPPGHQVPEGVLEQESPKMERLAKLRAACSQSGDDVAETEMLAAWFERADGCGERGPHPLGPEHWGRGIHGGSLLPPPAPSLTPRPEELQQ